MDIIWILYGYMPLELLTLSLVFFYLVLVYKVLTKETFVDIG
jgi:hypothetical protein